MIKRAQSSKHGRGTTGSLLVTEHLVDEEVNMF